jgi:hypothetical protein
LVGSPRAAIVADDDEFFHTKSLIRLAVWGVAAAASIAAVVYIARTELGTRRFATAIAAIGAPPSDPQQIATAQIAARIASAERDARRALETAQSVSTDRERTQSRIITIEHEMNELAGSVRRTAAVAPEPRPASEVKAAAPDSRANFPSLAMSSTASLTQPRNIAPGWAATPVQTQTVTRPEPAASKPAAAEPAQDSPPPVIANAPAANVPLPRPAPLALAPPTSPPAAAPTAEAAQAMAKAEETTASISPPETPAKVEFGVDLGPALTMARLRSRWSKLAAERPDLVKGLRPLVSVRDAGTGKPVEVRLLVGPMANVNSATDFCQSLASPQYLCRPAVFDGQRLTVQ